MAAITSTTSTFEAVVAGPGNAYFISICQVSLPVDFENLITTRSPTRITTTLIAVVDPFPVQKILLGGGRAAQGHQTELLSGTPVCIQRKKEELASV